MRIMLDTSMVYEGMKKKLVNAQHLSIFTTECATTEKINKCSSKNNGCAVLRRLVLNSGSFETYGWPG